MSSQTTSLWVPPSFSGLIFGATYVLNVGRILGGELSNEETDGQRQSLVTSLKQSMKTDSGLTLTWYSISPFSFQNFCYQKTSAENSAYMGDYKVPFTSEKRYPFTAEKTQADAAQLDALLLYGFLCSTVSYLNCGTLNQNALQILK